jgi:hypothetical protein
MSDLLVRRSVVSLINCISVLLDLKLRSKYEVLLFCYLNYSVCFRYFLLAYRRFSWKNRLCVVERSSVPLLCKDILFFRKMQYKLLNIFYEKLNFFSIFYNIRRKRKQRRSLYLVLAFDKHVCFKNIEREYDQLKLYYAKWL